MIEVCWYCHAPKYTYLTNWRFEANGVRVYDKYMFFSHDNSLCCVIGGWIQRGGGREYIPKERPWRRND